MMDYKYLNLINLLIDRDDSVSSKSIANSLSISIRSVKTYVSELNAEYPGIITSTHKGYVINRKIIETIKDLDQKRNRTTTILLMIIKDNLKPSLFDLSSRFYVSESTLRSDFKKITRLISQFNLEFKNVDGHYQILGLERNKRKLLTHILYSESKNNFLDISHLQDSFPEFDIYRLKDTIKEILDNYNYYLNDFAMMNLLLHIVVSLQRILKVENQYPKIHTEKFNISDVATSISNELEKIYNINYHFEEQKALTLLLMSIGMNVNIDKITLENLNNFISEQVIAVTKNIIEGINHFYYLNIEDELFLIRFTLHINNLINRLKIGRINRNPIVNSIKENCPLIYDCAVHATHEITKVYPFTIPDDEIGYIAFHIGSAIETFRVQKDKLKIVILSPNYYDMTHQLIEKLNFNFEKDIVISDLINDESLLENKDFDLLITQAPISNMAIESISVSPFLSHEEVRILGEKIQRIQLDKKRTYINSLLDSYFPKSLYFPNFDSPNKENTIEKLVSILEDFGCVGSDFLEEVLHREQLSQTSYNNVAMPHSLTMNAIKTNIVIAQLRKPIEWGTNTVKIVILIAISKEDRRLFADLFDVLSTVFTQEDLVNRFNNLCDYEELRSIILDNIK